MKTKIISTYGPAVEGQNILKGVLKYTDIMRINFSHADERSATAAIENIERAAKAIGKEISLLADLPGPKMRLGKLENDISLGKGDTVVMAYRMPTQPEKGVVPLGYDIYPYLRKGSVLSIGDGYLKLGVTSLSKGKITCVAISAGTLKSKKGVNITKGNVTAAPPTDEDKRLARFALKHGFDFIALSFVREPDNINELRRIVKDTSIISKIEREVAVKGIKGIVQASEAVMVARGDLALDVPMETIPVIQSQIVNTCRDMNKPVIIATQMLASMVSNPMPTRAEVNDIAHSVIDGADCLMLSEETAVGSYPIDAVKMLANTAKSAEGIASKRHVFKIGGIGDSIAFAAADIADNYETDAIFAPTQSGKTAARLSALRPDTRVIALSVSERVRKKLKIFNGIETEKIDHYKSASEMFRMVKEIAMAKGMRDYIVVSGSPNKMGTTNTLEYFRTGR